MADVYIGRFNRYFEKLFNIKGGPALVDVSADIQPVVQMSQPPTEERYLVGVESFASAGVQVAVAANFSAAMIRNPINSNIICTLEKIAVSGSTETLFMAVAGSNPTDLATINANHSRADPRTRSVGSCIVSNDAPAADPFTGFLAIGVINIQATANTDLILYPNQEIVLLPQIALRVIGRTVNQPLDYTFFWRERPLETSELT